MKTPERERRAVKGGGESPTEAAELAGHVVGTAARETQQCFASSRSFQSSAAGKAVPEPPLNEGSTCRGLRRGAADRSTSYLEPISARSTRLGRG